MMDRYPGDRRGATNDFYEGLRPKNPAPGPPPTVTQVDERNFFQFMDYAATYLCPRNAATSSAVPPPPPPVTVTAQAAPPAPPAEAPCTEGATRVLQNEGDIATCENGHSA